MGRTKYFIKNNQYGGYYQKTIFKGQKHFVKDISEARAFPSKKLANETVLKFNKPQNFEIIKV